MWTTEDRAELEVALRIAMEAHAGQLDKGGSPYILHPLHMMGQLSAVEDKIAALLHDVIEDGRETADTLSEKGIRPVVVAAVVALTRKRSESYGDMIDRVADNPLATRVKLKDLEHNLDMSRIPVPTIRDLERRQRYLDAMSDLTLALSRHHAVDV